MHWDSSCAMFKTALEKADESLKVSECGVYQNWETNKTPMKGRA